MTTADDRLLLDKVKQEVAPAMAPKLEPMKAIVIEVGSVGSAWEGMVRVRRDPHEPSDAGRPYYFCVGKVPVVDTSVWAMGNHATGFVFGDFVDPEDIPVPTYQTVLDGETAKPQRDRLSFGQAMAAIDDPTLNRTDVRLVPGALLAEPGADGFMPGADKSKLNGVETGATADQTNTEIMNLIKTVDGAGSALDADTVDGEHAGAFSQTGHTHGQYATSAHNHDGAYPPFVHFHNQYADEVHFHNQYAEDGHTHPHTHPWVGSYIAFATLGAGGTHLYTHGVGDVPRFVSAQINPTDNPYWRSTAEGIAVAAGEFEVRFNTTEVYISNHESTTMNYRFFLSDW